MLVINACGDGCQALERQLVSWGFTELSAQIGYIMPYTNIMQ